MSIFHSKSRREAKALKKIVSAMQSEEEMIIDNLAQQVEQMLLNMSPEEREKTIKILQRK